MKVYKSEYGEVNEGVVLAETPKGFRVLANRWGRDYERVWFVECPHGNHKTFSTKGAAKKDAEKFIDTKISAAKDVITRMEGKRANLLVV